MRWKLCPHFRAKNIEHKVEVNRTRTVEMLEAVLEKAELATENEYTFELYKLEEQFKVQSCLGKVK